MTISPDHIVSEKETIRMKRIVNLIEKKLQFHKVVKTLDGQDDVILQARFPGIDVERREFKSIGKFLFCRSAPASIQNFRIQVQTLELKIPNIPLEQPLSNVDLCRRVSGPDAENSACLFGPLSANAGDISPKHLNRVSKPKSLNDGDEMFIGPIVHDGRKFVDVSCARIIHKFRANPILVRLRT